MNDWNVLINDADITSVQEAYADYRRPIKRALIVLREGLPVAQQEAVLRDQAMLAPTATVSERVAWLARTCSALHDL